MLYHYTDFAAFDGIIRNAEIRLNNLLNMNDASEMRFFMDGIGKAVTERLYAEREFEKAHNTETFFDQEMEEEFHYSAYATCFSKHRDDAAQWERYGYKGQGVCIAFNSELIENMAGGAISLQEVFYQENVAGHPLVNEFYTLIKESDAFTTNRKRLQTLANMAWVQSAAYKHPSFASEQEYRLVVSPFISNEFAVEPKYFVTKDRIKKYYPLDLNKMCGKLKLHLSDLIGEIIIGPTSPQSRPILCDFLKDCGQNILTDKVSLSTCPLRSPKS